MIEVFKVIASFITGSLIAILGEPSRRKLERTRLSVSFDPKKDILTTPDDEYKFGKYVKIKLENKGTIKYAKQVRCYLISIEKKAFDEIKWDLIFDIPLNLNWSYLESAESIDLHPNMWAYFNILFFNMGQNKIRPRTKRQPMLWDHILNDLAFYRFTYYVTGENIRKPLKGHIEVRWDGEWNTFEIINFA